MLRPIAAALAAIALPAGALLAGAPPPARAGVIDFEIPVVASGTVADIAGDAYAAEGVRFATVRLSGSVARGNRITLAPITDGLRLYRDVSAISGAQGAGPAQGGAYNDLLMMFDRPLASLALTTDDLVETPHPLRLIALAPTDADDMFEVLDFVDAQDDAVAAPANRLALSGTDGFAFALFEVRSQQEGFDDLAFAFVAGTGGDGSADNLDSDIYRPKAIPAPSSLTLLAAGLLAAGATRGARPLRAATKRRLPPPRVAGKVRARGAASPPPLFRVPA
jgi:hypothetical protein